MASRDSIGCHPHRAAEGTHTHSVLFCAAVRLPTDAERGWPSLVILLPRSSDKRSMRQANLTCHQRDRRRQNSSAATIALSTSTRPHTHTMATRHHNENLIAFKGILPMAWLLGTTGSFHIHFMIQVQGSFIGDHSQI